jgi:hypothetical protein
VVGFLRCGYIALKEDADGHFGDRLDAGRFVAVDLVEADVVLAVAGAGELGHDEGQLVNDWILKWNPRKSRAIALLESYL